MSLRGKDCRVEIDPDLHDKLRKMAEFQVVEVSSLGAAFLEKMIAAEWHAFTVLLERMERSGLVRRANGAARKIADGE